MTDRRLIVTTYRELLLDPRWDRRRMEILRCAGFRCEGVRADTGRLCRRKKNLQVHHKYYLDGALAWDYPDDALIALCELCHKKRHPNPNQLAVDIDIAMGISPPQESNYYIEAEGALLADDPWEIAARADEQERRARDLAHGVLEEYEDLPPSEDE